MSDINFRILEREAIFQVISSYPPLKELDNNIQKNITATIERSLYNTTIDETSLKNIRQQWNNPDFLSYYSNICFKFKINADINSSINARKPKQIKEYVLSNIYNLVIGKYFGYIMKFPASTLSKLQGFISPYETLNNIGKFTILELNPIINEAYKIQLKFRENQEIKMKHSKMYTCKRCGEKKTREYEIQTRSGDEGGTLFVECIICHFVWRS